MVVVCEPTCSSSNFAFGPVTDCAPVGFELITKSSGTEYIMVRIAMF